MIRHDKDPKVITWKFRQKRKPNKAEYIQACELLKRRLKYLNSIENDDDYNFLTTLVKDKKNSYVVHMWFVRKMKR